MSDYFSVDVRFYRLSEELQPYFTALYLFDFHCRDGACVQDLLHPEWSAMRFSMTENPVMASIVPAARVRQPPFVVSGPTSRAIDFTVTTSSIWGLGLLPLGWARFTNVPACDVADKIVDGDRHEAYAAFRPLHKIVSRGGDDWDGTAERINAFLMEQDLRPVPSQDKILACQEALRDPEIADVAMLAERLTLGRRTLERLCSRYFGFPPKLLLRRQRFLRSLARFMLESRESWSKALDVQYFDHAHFVRDFRSFMGMTPTEYSEAPHPILDRIIAQRLADQGAAPQTDLPTVLRYAAEVTAAD